MKRYISAVLAAALIAGLTACGGGASATAQASEAPSSTVTPTSTPTHASRPVPNVAGKKYADAYQVLMADGFYGSAYGKDGKKWANASPDPSLVVASTTPAAGTVTDAEDIQINLGITEAQHGAVAKASADAAKLAARYEFDCGSAFSSSSDDSGKYHSLKEVWASPYYAGSDTCSVLYDGEYASYKPAALPSEQKIADIVKANGGDVYTAPIETFDTIMRLCVKLEPDYADKVVARMDWKRADAKAALALCPDAPHAAVLKDVLTSVKIDDGTHTVGQNMEPGTYRTKPGSKDCYWSRTTGGGNIIANDMVGFAPAGVTVTVYPGEGFESARCGVWTKIG